MILTSYLEKHLVNVTTSFHDSKCNTECPKKVLRLINNRTKAFCSFPDIFFVVDKRE